MFENINTSALLLIFLIALGTYSLRLFGILLSSKFVKQEGSLKLFLDYLPSSLLLALVVPSILKEGLIGILASLLIVFCMYKTNNVLLSLLCSVVLVALLRNYNF